MSEEARGDEPLTVGQNVVLRQPLAGYEAGTPGVVTRPSPQGAYVRLQTTGHTLSVPRELLETSEQAASD